MKWIAWAMYDEGEEWPHAPGIESIIEAGTEDGARAEYVRIHGDHFHGEDYIVVKPAAQEDIDRIEALDRCWSSRPRPTQGDPS